MLGSLILYLKGMRIMMFQLSGFYYTETETHPEWQLTTSSAAITAMATCLGFEL